MKGTILAIISFLIFTSPSCGGRLLENNLFIASDNSWAFNPNLNSVVDDGSRLEKDGVTNCHEEISPWSSSSQNNGTKEQKNLSFRLTPKATQNEKKADESPASNKAEAVFHLLPKGKVTPSGPSPKVNSMVTEQRLSTSKGSPGVGHMQMIRPKPQKINGDILKSHQSTKRNKRKLGSSPSPGGGH